MANISTLHYRLSQEAIGAPPALMTLKVRDAARMFMREVPAWREDHLSITLINSTAEYPLTMPVDAELVRVLYAKFVPTGQIKGRPLEPLAESMLRPDFRDLDGSPVGFMTPKLNIIEVAPTPDPTNTNLGIISGINMQLRPSRTATTIIDGVLDRWEEEIMTGALWLIYDMQDKPWTNKAEARRYKLRFTKYWADARRELDKGFSRTDLKVKIPAI